MLSSRRQFLKVTTAAAVIPSLNFLSPSHLVIRDRNMSVSGEYLTKELLRRPITIQGSMLHIQGVFKIGPDSHIVNLYENVFYGQVVFQPGWVNKPHQIISNFFNSGCGFKWEKFRRHFN